MSDTPAQLRAAVEGFRPSGSGPVPTDPWTMQYWEMSNAHAMILNALLAIYEQAPDVPKHKHTNFIGFCLVWCANFHAHHEHEENTYFAMYEPKVDTSFVQEEHDAFQKGQSEFESYLFACLPPNHPYGQDKRTSATQAPLDFDGVRLQQLIDSFVKPLSTHLAHEITILEPEKLKAAGMSKEEMVHIAEVTQAYGSQFAKVVKLPTRTQFLEGLPCALLALDPL
ncbi:uncharacterized protein PHACADRAFT_186418 [Phanerochaete carnosa HHB-10118-sp]|uniref:Hemerythrin-like domain-containing protein n=1 Tax=Phanerochaete carnosa (strain HHB-10118-sp) TaxID=650164 RepID=K5UQW5_PHACS|nr:uncharacterized protein PHACADRAFT_186418 [Phanerochaete carnosa HHB-10118-sp]EKM52231.1 hypothetical protein PHACADRAFT_186418 [Phanerochaete carnosa HHB-10118-sp]